MTKKLKDRLLAMQGFRRRPPRPPKNLNWQEGEESIASFDSDLPHVRRPWSDFCSQLEGVLRQRGAAAIPFPVDAELRASLRNLVLTLAAMEGIGMRFRPAGHFALGPDLVGALTALRGEIGRAYDAARDGNDADAIAFATRAQKDLKTVLAAVKIAWPHPSATCQSAARED
jgi:hypothetical protein